MGVRTRGRTPGRTAGKVKRTVCLGGEASRRLDVEAVGSGRTVSAVVESLVLAHCRRFRLHDCERPAPAGEEAA